MNDPITFSQMAKIAEDNSCVLLSKTEWDAFTKKLWQSDEENKRLKKLNEKLRSKLSSYKIDDTNI